MYGDMTHTAELQLSCETKSKGLSNYLDLNIKDGDLISFGYTAVTHLGDGAPNPSCSIDGSKLKDPRGKNDSIWNKTASGYVVKLINSASENDQVIIKKTETGYTFDFKNVSPMNCGQSSGIAEKITIRYGSKKCIIHKLRN